MCFAMPSEPHIVFIVDFEYFYILICINAQIIQKHTNMKFKHYILLLGALLMALTSCENNLQEIGDPELSLSRTSIEFPAEGGTETIYLTSNISWKLKDYDDYRDWLTISPSKGEGSDEEIPITITALPNEGVDRSQVTITFYGNVIASDKLKISQAGSLGDGLEEISVVDFIEKADTVTRYKLTGKISGYNSSYVSFDLVDETGSVYVYSVSEASKAEYADVLATGGIVTISAVYYWYEHATDPSKSKVEIMKADIISYEAPDSINPETLEVTTVADFLEKADIFTTCKLEGRVVNYNDSYVSFDLKDETGSVYVYSLDNASKEEYGENLKNGDYVTILAVYYWYENASDPSKSKPEIMSARIVEYEPLDLLNIEEITIGEFLEKADEFTPYKLTGKVSGFYSGTNSSGKYYIGFNLVDSTGSITIYSLDTESMEEYGDVIEDGATMTLVGTYYWFENSTDSSKSKAEISGASIISYEAPEPIDPDALETLSVKEFIEKADAVTPYKLSGKVSGFYTGTNNSGKDYMGFNLVDSTGSITVYSFTDATFNEYVSKLVDGALITLYGYYQFYEKDSKHEVVNATIIAFEKPMAIDPSTLETISVSDFIAKADAINPNKLTGTVSGFYTGTNNSGKTYMGFDLVDASGKIAVYSFDNATFEEYFTKLADGGKVTLYGYYQLYEKDGSSKHEVVNATIVEYEAPTPIDPSTIETISVAEFLNRADATKTYRLTGTISGYNAQYCSFDLVQDGAKIYVHSCDAASKATYGSVLANGDTVTLTGKYYWFEHASDPSKSKAEINPATIESRIPGDDGGGTVDPDRPAAGSEVTVAKFLAMKDTNNEYQLTGTISKLGANYKDFTLTDATGSIYVYSLDSASKTKYGDVLLEGKTITIKGKYVEYNGEAEIKNAVIVSYEGGEGVKPIDPSDYIQITCAEFNALSEGDKNVYILTGTVTQIDNNTNGNLYINDGTATTYIFGILTASGNTGQFQSFDVKIGDTLTVFGKFTFYDGAAEMKSATFVSREKGPDHDKVVALAHSLVSGIAWTKVSKAYDNKDSGTSKQSAVVNGVAVDNLLKLSNSSTGGVAKLTIPEGVTKIGFYAAAWAGGATLTVGGTKLSIPANGGCNGNAPYNLEFTDDTNWFEVDVTPGTVDISADKRLVLIGINAL